MNDEFLAINHLQRKLGTQHAVHGAILHVAQASDSAALLLSNPSSAQTITGQNLTLSNAQHKIVRNSAGSITLSAEVTGDTVARFASYADGKLEWGDGALTRDVNLYRTAANTLKTDDGFQAASYAVGNIVVVDASQNATFDTLSASDITASGTVKTTSVTDATSVSTGALQSAGGAGIAKNIWIGGQANIGNALSVTGNFAVNTNKFTVAAASGNTVVAGTLSATGDLAVNTNKFTVAAATGNTAVAGTLAVTGAVTLTSALSVGSGGTGTSSAPTQGGVIYASSTSAYASTAAGTANQILQSNGASAPSWTSTPTLTGLTVSNTSAANVVTVDSSYDPLILTASNDTAGNSAGIIGKRKRTAGNGSVQNGDTLTGLYAFGYTSSSAWSLNIGTIKFVASENFTSSANGTYCVVETTPNGSSSRSERMRITGDGNVGINNASPSYKLDVAETSTSSATANILVRGVLTINPATASTAASEAISGQLVLNGGANNITSRNSGGLFKASHTGTGTVSRIDGITVDSFSKSTAGTITALSGIRINSPSASTGTVTTAYGVYVDTQKSSAQVTTGWGVYQASTSDVNAFAGNVRIGSTTAPTTTLDVTGSVAVSGAINKITVTAPATGATLTLAEGSTFATSGAYSTTLTATAATNVTLPTTGTLATLNGTETLVNKTLTSPKVDTQLTLGTYVVESTITKTINVNTAVTLDSFDSSTANIDGLEYLIVAYSPTVPHRLVTKVLMTWNASDAYITEYGMLKTNSSFSFDISASKSSNTITLSATSSAGSAGNVIEVTLKRTAIRANL